MKSGQNKTKKVISLLIALAVVLVLDFFYAHVDVKQYLYERRVDSSKWESTRINNEWEFVESFIEKDSAIDGFFLRITCNGAVSEVKNAALLYKLTDESGKVLYKGELPAEQVKSGKFNKLKFDKEIPDTKGKRFNFVVMGREMHGAETLSINFTQEIEGAQSKMIVDNKLIPGQAIVARSFNHRFNLETFIVAFGFVAFIYLFMKLLGKLFAR